VLQSQATAVTPQGIGRRLCPARRDDQPDDVGGVRAGEPPMATAQDLERDLRELYNSDDVSSLSRRLADMASPDMVQEWPQSGERIVGRQNVIAVNEHYEESTGTKPSIELRRLVRPG